jgi:MFS family permease
MKKDILKLIIYRFLDDFILVYPVYSILFQNNGLSNGQISILLVIWSATTILLEVPSGMLADKYSRKNQLLVSQIIRSIGYIFWLLGGSFWNYAIGFILWGIKGAMFSGTFEAFIFDKLKSEKKEEQYESVIGKIKTAGFIGVTLALLLGGWLSEMDYNIVLYASIIVPVIATLLFSTIKEAPKSESTEETKYLSFLKNALIETRSDKILMILIIGTALTYSIYGASDEFFALISTSMGASESLVGILLAVQTFSSSLAGVVITKFPNKENNNFYESAYIVIAGIFFIVAWVFQNPFALLLTSVSTFFLSITEIKIENKMQKVIDSKQRATVLSLKSLVYEGLAIGVTLLLGFVGDNVGMNNILLIVGSLIFLSAFSFLPKLKIKE